MITKLSKHSSQPSRSNHAWSARMEQRYRCRLSADLADWFDAEIWKRTGHGEYHLPVDPETLLGESPEAIWPALMPCDLLPLIGNDAGDWLCVRFDDDSCASEIVQWYHGGGDWIPWGDSIAEAIVFDAVRDCLPGPKRSHATPAESPGPLNSGSNERSDPILDWACRYMPPAVKLLVHSGDPSGSAPSVLIDAGVCEVAVRCTLMEAALHEPLSEILTRDFAEGMGIEWDAAIEWMFDNERIPPNMREQLSRKFNVSLEATQDWESAAQQCLHVTQHAPALAWAWDILGYCHERAGNFEAAITAYVRGVQSSVFTDQSVRLRTHWTSTQASKFSAARLLNVAPAIVQQSTYLRMLCEGDAEERRRQATLHWLAESDQATAGGDVGIAHQNLVRAGWDLGAEPLTMYADILERVGETAVQADRAAQAELADTHRACLRSRFGI